LKFVGGVIWIIIPILFGDVYVIARQLLLHSYRWGIGSGNNICIMTDPWLWGNQGCWISTPRNEGVYQMYVTDLLLYDYKVWDSTKICNLFTGPVVNDILEAPLFALVHGDKLVLEDDKNGRYYVKSSYNLAMRHIVHSERFHVVGNWNGVWKSQSPHKAHHLLWRLCRWCLPMRSYLSEWHMNCLLLYHICDYDGEDDLHVFFEQHEIVGIQQAFSLSYTMMSINMSL
jgi:hypothetical protein